MSFTYNEEGLRVSKTVNGVTTQYIYDGSLLVAEYDNSKIIVYIYDAFGTPIGFKYGYTDGIRPLGKPSITSVICRVI